MEGDEERRGVGERMEKQRSPEVDEEEIEAGTTSPSRFEDGSVGTGIPSGSACTLLVHQWSLSAPAIQLARRVWSRPMFCSRSRFQLARFLHAQRL